MGLTSLPAHGRNLLDQPLSWGQGSFAGGHSRRWQQPGTCAFSGPVVSGDSHSLVPFAERWWEPWAETSHPAQGKPGRTRLCWPWRPRVWQCPRPGLEQQRGAEWQSSGHRRGSLAERVAWPAAPLGCFTVVPLDIHPVLLEFIWFLRTFDILCVYTLKNLILFNI